MKCGKQYEKDHLQTVNAKILLQDTRDYVFDFIVQII